MTVMLPKLWKIFFNNGIIIPVKMRRRNECKGEILCMTCNIQINENKEFEANINELKTQALNQIVHMVPYYKVQFYCQLFRLPSIL